MRGKGVTLFSIVYNKHGTAAQPDDDFTKLKLGSLVADEF